jgi:hypothetical protein
MCGVHVSVCERGPLTWEIAATEPILAYPHLKLRDLTPEAADAIYRRDDWPLIMICSPTP